MIERTLETDVRDSIEVRRHYAVPRERVIDAFRSSATLEK